MKFVIGDIHGELIKLKSLLNNIIQLDPNPSFIFIGDYLDKGENPLQTIVFLSELSQKFPCIFLRGNHEYYWELVTHSDDKYAAYLNNYGGLNTILSISPNATITEAKTTLFTRYSNFFSSLQNWYWDEQFLITHSGLPHKGFGSRLEDLTTEDFLFNRYEFIQSEELYKQRKLIFGHTAFFSPYFDGYKIGIDTAACYLPSQPLTSFCLTEHFFLNSNNQTLQLTDLDTTVCPVIVRTKPWRQIMKS